MLLQLSTWLEVESYLEQSQGIIIPIGSTEQHGPTGLIGTDALCAEAIAKGVGKQVGAMVAPTLNVGMALHHTAFPGTISLRPSTLIQVILDYVTCLARAGFRQFFFINGHGGNIATLKAAFAETYYHLDSLLKNAFLSEKVASGHGIYGAANFRQNYPDGRMGSNPALATPEHGQRFYELAVKELSNSYLEWLSCPLSKLISD